MGLETRIMGAYSFSKTLLDGVTATGESETLNLDGWNVKDVWISVEGITTATVIAEGSVDGTNWYGLSTVNVNTSALLTSVPSSTGITADGLTKIGFPPPYVRLNVSAYTAGTITGIITVLHE